MKRTGFAVPVLLAGCWLLSLWLLPAVVFAEPIPALVAVPAGLPPEVQAKLSRERESLNQELQAFLGDAERFNATPAEAQTDAEFAALGQRRAQCVNNAKAFNREVAKSKPIKGDPKVVKGVDISRITVQDGVDNPVQLRQDLLGDFSVAISARTAQPNEQAQEVLKSLDKKDPPPPVKNIDKLAAGDVILVAPVPMKKLLKQPSDVVVSNGINLLDKWGSDNWSSPASHAAVFLGERNGKRWYLDNTGTDKGPVIKEESAFLKEYGARQIDVATLVGQPLSQHEGKELWKGAHELRNTVKYGPSQFLNWGSDYGMVCSESSRWLLLRAGRRVPETKGGPVIVPPGIVLKKKDFVTFSPSDFYENSPQYFIIHRLSLEKKEGSQP